MASVSLVPDSCRRWRTTAWDHPAGWWMTSARTCAHSAERSQWTSGESERRSKRSPCPNTLKSSRKRRERDGERFTPGARSACPDLFKVPVFLNCVVGADDTVTKLARSAGVGGTWCSTGNGVPNINKDERRLRKRLNSRWGCRLGCVLFGGRSVINKKKEKKTASACNVFQQKTLPLVEHCGYS